MARQLVGKFLFLTFMLGMFGGSLFGQTAEITGVVTDPNAAAVAGAAVTVRNVETSIVFESTTNSQGYYTFPLLNPGKYELAVSKAGFRTANRPGIQLYVAQVARIDIGLTLGEIRESVSVEAEAPILASESATVQQVIGSKKITDLPLNGRDFTQLATLTPGAISRGTNSSMQAPSMSVDGSRVGKTVFMIDGGSVSSQYFDVASIVPSVDAIQEFSVQTNSLRRRIWARHVDRERFVAIGNQPNARRSFRVPAQSGARRAQLFQHHRRTAGGETESIRIYSGRSDRDSARI